MQWTNLTAIAQRLAGTTIEGDRVLAGDRLLARRIDAGTVLFPVADNDARDALIAAAPRVFFVTARFAEIDGVLAHLESLDFAQARARLEETWRESGMATAPLPDRRLTADTKSKPTGPRRWLLLYLTDSPKPERRVFRKLGHGTAADYLLRCWRSHARGTSWGTELPAELSRDLENRFYRLDENDGVTCPDDDASARMLLARELECKPHVFSGGGDDDEALSWEYFVFDDEYMSEEQSDYLPHPERGERPRNQDDGYRTLLARYRKHRKTTR